MIQLLFNARQDWKNIYAIATLFPKQLTSHSVVWLDVSIYLITGHQVVAIVWLDVSIYLILVIKLLLYGSNDLPF